MRVGGHYSLFIIQYYGILRVWFPGTAQIISKKRGVADVSRQVKTDVGGDEKLTFKFVWPNVNMHTIAVHEPQEQIWWAMSLSV